MKTRTGMLVATALSFALLATTANAHPQHGRGGVDRLHAYSHVPSHAPARAKHMPHRLRHDKHFRRWYRHSSVRHNPYLPWWKVYRVYERQMAPQRQQYYERHRYRDNYRDSLQYRPPRGQRG
jgi:hypothetical protein